MGPLERCSAFQRLPADVVTHGTAGVGQPRARRERLSVLGAAAPAAHPLTVGVTYVHIDVDRRRPADLAPSVTIFPLSREERAGGPAASARRPPQSAPPARPR